MVALIKAGWLQVLSANEIASPGNNCISGRIEEIIEDDEGPNEVRIGLANGQTLCAVSSQRLQVGDQVKVQFAPSCVLLGIAV
ncbi:DNA-binding transcriptional regulator ModE [compost metagenome]